MSDHEPLDPSLAKLFRAAPRPELSRAARERMTARFVAALPALGSVPSPLGSGAGSLAPHGAHAAALGSHGMALLGAALVAGGVIGSAVTLAVAPAPTVRTVYVERPAPSAPATAHAPSDPEPPPSSVASAPVAPVAPETHPPPKSSVSRDPLAAERGLLDDARGRLAAGDPASALARLNEHAIRFPHGQLGEEREALAIEALVQSGHYDDARARAGELRRRSPSSVFLPAVDATLGSIP